MFPKIIIAITVCVSINTLRLNQKVPVRAWINIEGKVENLYVRAKFENNGDKFLSLGYVLEVTKKGYSGNSNSLQRGKFIAPVNKIITLSESRMNLRKGEELMAKLVIYHQDIIVAQDSVVFHGDNY